MNDDNKVVLSTDMEAGDLRRQILSVIRSAHYTGQPIVIYTTITGRIPSATAPVAFPLRDYQKKFVESMRDLPKWSITEIPSRFADHSIRPLELPDVGHHQKMGKRERNKVHVPIKEKQVVNGNNKTKKKRKRK